MRVNFPRRIPSLKEFIWRWFMLQNSHHQLQRGEVVYNFYALIVTTRYISGRYVSEEVVRVNFPRRIPGLKLYSFVWDSEVKYTISGKRVNR